jgi:hypothetical protein
MTPGKGQCQACGGWYRIVGGGAVKPHRGGPLGLVGGCPGSGQQPTDPVPCTDCGQTGKALPSKGGCCTVCARRSGAFRG